MRRKRHDDSSSGYYWMDTYGDMVTLLLTFFVLLYSMSTIDAKKWQVLVTALRGDKHIVVQDVSGNGGGLENSDKIPPTAAVDRKVTEVKEFDDLYYYLKQYFDENDIDSKVDLHKGDGYTFITFQNNIFFDGDSSVLRHEAIKILDFLADALKNISDDVGEIRAYGHTARARGANQPNTIEGDRTLSCLRANNVIIHLQKKNIIEPKKMVAEGYGEHRPIAPHDGTEETRIKNRRVEIYIAKADKSNLTLDKIYEEINRSEKDN
jgi:chemotaxis protein MotB